MPSLPTAIIENEADVELAGHHVHPLSLVEERAAAACALNVDDATLAHALALSAGAVRAQRFRAVHHILDLTNVESNRIHLGRWCLFHWDCCLVRIARQIEDGTWLVA